MSDVLVDGVLSISSNDKAAVECWYGSAPPALALLLMLVAGGVHRH
jgi:hypothetical protein